MRSLFLPILLALCFLSGEAYARSFLDPLYEKLDTTAMRAELDAANAQATLTSPQALNRLQTLYFLSEAAGLEQKIHERSQLITEASRLCNQAGESEFKAFTEGDERAMAQYTCALVYVAACEDSHPLWQFSLVKKIDALLRAAATVNTVPQFDRYYVEGRIFAGLPRNLGQRLGKALFNLQLLSRMKPEASSVLFWLAHTYQAQGNESAAKEYFEKALTATPPDRRAQIWFAGVDYVRDQDHLDGLSFGWSPNLFFSPQLGFGIGLSLYDDRMWDERRAGRLNLTVTTRENFEAGLRYDDDELVKGFTLGFDADAGQYREEYYGLGMTTLKTNLSLLKNVRAAFALRASQTFWDYFFFTLGWRFASSRVSESLGGSFATDPLIARNQSSHTGPFVALGYDNRDSRKAPRKGYLARLSGYFPTTALLSDYGFEQFQLYLESHFALGLKHTLSAHGGAMLVSTGAPYSALPRLGQNLNLPGVRPARFQENNILGASLQYRYELMSSFSLMAFASAGAAVAQAKDLGSGPWRAGGGLGVLFHPARYHQPTIRLETGVFASEFILTASAGLNF